MHPSNRRLLKGPDNSFLLTTKPFLKPSRHQHKFEIVLKSIEPPFSSKVDEELDYLAKTFGFLEPFGKQNSAGLVFKELASPGIFSCESGLQGMLSSTELSKRLGKSRGAVINQLNNLQRSGIIVKRGRLYGIRSKSMLRTVEELQSDVEKVFEKAKKVAKQIDKETGLEI